MAKCIEYYINTSKLATFNKSILKHKKNKLKVKM